MAASYLTIVSGLPRSGTSMMMQVLCAGGLEALADHQRKADEDNPRGYYEFEAVKRTRQDPTWLMASHGKVVKMVSMLLYNLPSSRKYKVIFMRRNMTEILASQRAMLERTGQGKDFNDQEMGALFGRHLKEIEQWLAAQKNFEVLFLSMDKTAEGMLAFMRKEKMKCPALVFDKVAAADDLKKYYSGKGIPCLSVIDQKGVLVLQSTNDQDAGEVLKPFVVLVEKGELTGGSTFHAAGLVGQLRSSASLTRMMVYSTDLYRRLKDERRKAGRSTS